MNGDVGIEDYGMFAGLDAAVQVPADVPQAFNDAAFVDGMIGPDDPWFQISQSAATDPAGSISLGGPNAGDATYGGLQGIGKYSQGFLDTAAKLLTQLRGNSGQDRSPATGRARPQRSLADVLGLGAASGTVNPQAPGSQGMWMLMVAGAAILALMLFAGKR